MHNGKTLQKRLWQIRQLKTWQLLIVLVLFMFITAIFLRLNNVGMVERRAAVLAADKAGEDSKTTARLYDLQRYSASHMNANTGVFYLEQQYNRDVQKAISGGNAGGSATNLHASAEAVCRPQFGNTYSTAYLRCFLNELNKHPSGQVSAGAIKMPSSRLYQHEFISPLWSPDFAGFSALACIGVIMVILFRLITLIALKIMLKRHYASA